MKKGEILLISPIALVLAFVGFKALARAMREKAELRKADEEGRDVPNPNVPRFAGYDSLVLPKN